MQKQIEYSQIRAGSLISYRLFPYQLPTNPHKLWQGKIISVIPERRVCWVISTEPGYEGLEECILLDQIVEVVNQS
jgi:hypothetical protein